MPEPCALSSICPLARPETLSVTSADTSVGSVGEGLSKPTVGGSGS